VLPCRHCCQSGSLDRIHSSAISVINSTRLLMTRPKKTKNAGVRAEGAFAQAGAKAKFRPPTKPRPPKRSALTKVPSMAADDARKRVEKRFADHIPEVTPLELAHLVIAMGLASDEKGPSQAAILLGRCARFLENSRELLKRFGASEAAEISEKIVFLERLGCSPEAPPDRVSVNQIVKIWNLERLKVEGKDLRGRSLLMEFLSRVPANGMAGNPEDGLTLVEAINLEKAYNQWRNGIAKKNQAAGKKNLQRIQNDAKDMMGGDADFAVSMDEQRGNPFTRGPRG
jgi:hypothetical protein